jgi:hypothetical protein
VHAGTGLLAIVQMYNGTGGLVQERTTNANGSFVMSSIPFGVYEVRVSSPGYQRRTLTNVTLGPASPVVDLGDIELSPIPPETFDWFTILIYIGLIAGIASAVAAGIVLAVRRRRRRTEPAPARAEAPAVPTVRAAETAPPAAAPATTHVAPVPAAPAEIPQIEEYVFECPQCGTTVSGDAKSCPGCGAIFE